jgi:hypothetical protein
MKLPVPQQTGTPEEVAAWAKLQGFQADEKVAVKVRTWEGIRRTLANMMETAVQVVRECDEQLERCKHAPGCTAQGGLVDPCPPECPDREFRLSALVIRANFARYVGMYTLPKGNSEGVTLPPAREFLDQMISELELLRARDDWRRDLYDGPRLEAPAKEPQP